MLKKAHLSLDNKYANFNNDSTEISWDITNTLNSYSDNTGVIKKIGKIKSVKLSSFKNQKIDSLCNRCVIEIKELNSQSMNLNGNKFHFHGLINDMSSELTNLVPNYNKQNKMQLYIGHNSADGVYKFNQPIDKLDKVTLRMYNPFNPVAWTKYYVKNVQIVPILINPSNISFTLVFEDSLYNLGYVDLNINIRIGGIFIDNLTSTSVVDAPLCNYLNSHELTNNVLVDQHTIQVNALNLYEIGEDFTLGTSITNSVTGLTSVTGTLSKCNVSFIGYRHVFNLELSYLDDTQE